ncbi:MAG: hypothetical protein AB1730_21075 [Myxococcota bacterium]
MLEAHDDDVVVADFAMPVRDGPSLLEDVSRRWPRPPRAALWRHAQPRGGPRVAR